MATNTAQSKLEKEMIAINPHLTGVVAAIAFCWSLFQLYSVSKVPYILTEWLGVNVTFALNDVKIIHLSFALLVASFLYPIFDPTKRKYLNAMVACVMIIPCVYLLFYKLDIADRPGLPIASDIIMSSLGLLFVLTFAKRSLGYALVIVASVFLFYVFFGHSSYLPDSIQWKGASYGKAMWHFWMQGEGVFGVALGVSASLIFMFVLFGSLLEKSGAGNYFIKLSFSLFGKYRGGPAKAAVFSSALTGIISGSSIANTVTTGTFTIPLMKRTGFSAEKAGAIEVASSTNGQLTPPVMGAAAFLMVEYTGVSYLEVIKHAFLPAVISYITLFYIVHLEAVKLNLGRLTNNKTIPIIQTLMRFIRNCLIFFVLCLAVYYGFSWVKVALEEDSFIVAVLVIVFIYLGLIYLAASNPDLADADDDMLDLPDFQTVLVSGLHFILPIFILIWCLMIEKFSPGLSVYWATIAMIIVQLTQHPLKVFFRKQSDYIKALKKGGSEFTQGMIAGAVNMTGIAIATAVAGIVVGTVSLTGAHQVLGDFVEALAGGNLLAMLFLVALFSLVLGMGLPTTANYIVVSSLMAPIIVTLGAQAGLIVPLIAAHMFVFYFGILADDTPPVGLAAYAAAGISGGDPIKTGLQGFAYDIRTAILPFMFIFNTDLLLVNVGFWEGVFVFCTSLVAMFMFASAVQQQFFARNKIWESVAMLMIAFTLFRPGFFMDKVVAPYESTPVTNVFEVAEKAEAGGFLLFNLSGPHPVTDRHTKLTMQIPLGEKGDAQERIQRSTGMTLRIDGDKLIVDDVAFSSAAEKQYVDIDWEVNLIRVPAEQPPKQLFFIPAFILLFIIVFSQRRRSKLATVTA